MRSLIVVFVLVYINITYSRVSRLLVLNSPGYAEGAGFFHNFHIVIGLLDYIEKNPSNALKIDFQDQGLYYESSMGKNWWNYYFEPLFIFPKNNCHIKFIDKVLDDTSKIYFGNNTLFYFSREKAAHLIKKYIKIKQDIETEVADFRAQFFKDNYIIGVHYRATDKLFEAPKVDLEVVEQVIHQHIKNHLSKTVKIFLATDDREAKDFFVRRFKDKVIYCNTRYSSGLTGSHYLHRGYLSGKEALIDCLLLSQCHLLIRTSSNLSAASAFFNPKIPVINLNTFYKAPFPHIKMDRLNELHRVHLYKN